MVGGIFIIVTIIAIIRIPNSTNDEYKQAAVNIPEIIQESRPAQDNTQDDQWIQAAIAQTQTTESIVLRQTAEVKELTQTADNKKMIAYQTASALLTLCLIDTNCGPC
jgi:hypothetical protein